MVIRKYGRSMMMPVSWYVSALQEGRCSRFLQHGLGRFLQYEIYLLVSLLNSSIFLSACIRNWIQVSCPTER